MHPSRFISTLVVASILGFGGHATAASTSQISPAFSFTLVDILFDDSSAEPFFDYEPDNASEAFSFFAESFLLGGTGSTSGSSSSTQNGVLIDENLGGDAVETGDTFVMTLDSSATANTGFVNRSQVESIAFAFSQFVDSGSGSGVLTYEFDYSLTYTTSLTNDIAGNQALARFDMMISVEDEIGVTTLDLFPQSTTEEIFALSFAQGTVTPGNTVTGSFSLEAQGFASFLFEGTASTPTNVNVVPIPGAAWLLFGPVAYLISRRSRRFRL